MWSVHGHVSFGLLEAVPVNCASSRGMDWLAQLRLL